MLVELKRFFIRLANYIYIYNDQRRCSLVLSVIYYISILEVKSFVMAMGAYDPIKNHTDDEPLKDSIDSKGFTKNAETVG